VSRTSAAQASPGTQSTRQGARKTAGHQGHARQRAGGPLKRANAGAPAAPAVDPLHPTSPERYDPPIGDPMAGLAGLAERSLRESLESLRWVSESRTLSELLERQSRHMRLMTEIWMRQAQRSMEVFNAMLSDRLG
jgi:hypothetical protein